MVEEHRVEHGLADGHAIWLRNLSLLLEDEHWEAPMNERLIWPTRHDYIEKARHMQREFHLAPLDIDFVLTEHGPGLTAVSVFPMHGWPGYDRDRCPPMYVL